MSMARRFLVSFSLVISQSKGSDAKSTVTGPFLEIFLRVFGTALRNY
jgi:hypothetical protein